MSLLPPRAEPSRAVYGNEHQGRVAGPDDDLDAG